MKKLEYLSNAQKTVLKLEKEINVISTNLSKVKNKDHTAMKKIIHNINYLLAEEAYKEDLYNKESNNRREENSKMEEKSSSLNINNESNQNTYRNIDYLLMLNKQKNNNIEKNKNKSYFNRKCLSSSKINTDNILQEKKYLNTYRINRNVNMNIKDNSLRKKIIDKSNHLLYNTNQMTYSKPKLLTEYGKRSSLKNINLKNEIKDEQKNNTKYLTLNEKSNKMFKRSNKYKNPSILNTLYYNYNDNNENILNSKYLSNNKIKYNHESHELTIRPKYKDFEQEDYDYEYEKRKKNNKKKMQKHQIIELFSNSKNFFYNNTINGEYYKNNINNNINFPYCPNIDDDDLDINNISKKKIRKKKNYSISSFNNNNDIKKSNETFYVNKKEKNYNKQGNNRLQKMENNNLDNLNYNISLKLKKNNNTINGGNEENNKINQLLNLLNTNNINEAIIKIKSLLKYEKEKNQLKELYYNNKDNDIKKFKSDENDIFISNIIKNYKRNEKYKNLCQNIMILNKIKNFKDFKIFIKNLLSENKGKNDYIYKENNENINNLNSNLNSISKTGFNYKRKNLNINNNDYEDEYSNKENDHEDIGYHKNNYKIISEDTNSYD